MKLTELEPQFFKYDICVEPYNVVDGDPATWNERGRPTRKVVGPKEYHVNVDLLAAAHAIRFLCPKCFKANCGAVGTHLCHVTFANHGVPDGAGMKNRDGQPVQWNVSGTGYHDLSTTPSILIIGGCDWHGYITNGDVSII